MTQTQAQSVAQALAQPAIWLRDNCCCPHCRDPRNGQKLLGILDLGADLTVTSTDGTTVKFSDGHISRFDPAFLAAGTAPDERCEDGKQLWARTEPPVGDWARFRSDPEHRADCLAAIMRKGFTLLSGVPVVPGMVLDVAAGFGYVRETNYGKLFDVRVEATPANLAFTGLPIAPHTDNPYRDPVPTVRLLHCLSNVVSGGESGLVDGFHAAAMLRGQNPEAFDVLTSTPVTFRFADARTELAATRPLIGIGPDGRIREIRFNSRSMQPLRLPAEQTAAFYAAYRAFAEILHRPQLMGSPSGSVPVTLIFDNTRLLHSRTGFADTGDRHLQGCYADLDAVASRRNVPARAARRRPDTRTVRARSRRLPWRGHLPGSAHAADRRPRRARRRAIGTGHRRLAARRRPHHRPRPDGRHRQPAQRRRRHLARSLVPACRHRADPPARRGQTLPLCRRPGLLPATLRRVQIHPHRPRRTHEPRRDDLLRE